MKKRKRSLATSVEMPWCVSMPTADTINRRAKKWRNSSRHAKRKGQIPLQPYSAASAKKVVQRSHYLFYRVWFHFCFSKTAECAGTEAHKDISRILSLLPLSSINTIEKNWQIKHWKLQNNVPEFNSLFSYPVIYTEMCWQCRGSSWNPTSFRITHKRSCRSIVICVKLNCLMLK